MFTSEKGHRLDQGNLMSRVLKPAAVRAGIGQWVITPKGKRAEAWVGHRTFRHTNATLLFRHGWNAKQVQVWLGHHSSAFTLATYGHLLAEGLPELPLEWGNKGATQDTETGRNDAVADATDSAQILCLARAV